MKLISILLCLCLILPLATEKTITSQPLKNTPKTSTSSVLKIIPSQSNLLNPIISFFEFLKNFFQAIYEQDIRVVFDMILCVFNNLRSARLFLYLAWNELIKFNFRGFLEMLYQVWKILRYAPWC